MKFERAVKANEAEWSGKEAEEAVLKVLNDEIEGSFNKKYKLIKAGLPISFLAIASGIYLKFIQNNITGLYISVVGAFIGLAVFGYSKFSRPNLKVSSVKKRYWKIHQIPQGDSTIYYDADEVYDSKNFKIEELEGVEQLSSAKEGFEDQKDLPVIKSESVNPEKEIMEGMNSFRTTLQKTKSSSFDAPLIGKEDTVFSSLESMREEASVTEDNPGRPKTKLVEAKENARAMKEIESLAFEKDAEEALIEIKEISKYATRKLKESHKKSIQKLNEKIDSVGETVSIRSYNFYCTACIDDNVYSEVEWDMSRDVWICSTCEREYDEDEDMIPKNRIKDELVESISDQLWIELDQERRELYNSIEDKKDDLKHKELERKREEIKEVGQRIKDIKSEVRSLEAEAEASKESVEKLGNLMTEYGRIEEERRQEFRKDVNEESERIHDRVEDMIEKERAEDQKALQKAEKQAQKKSKLTRIEQQKKEREKLAMEQEMHKQEMEAKAAEMKQKNDIHERDILEDRGLLGGLSTLNKAKIKLVNTPVIGKRIGGRE